MLFASAIHRLPRTHTYIYMYMELFDCSELALTVNNNRQRDSKAADWSTYIAQSKGLLIRDLIDTVASTIVTRRRLLPHRSGHMYIHNVLSYQVKGTDRNTYVCDMTAR